MILRSRFTTMLNKHDLKLQTHSGLTASILKMIKREIHGTNIFESLSTVVFSSSEQADILASHMQSNKFMIHNAPAEKADRKRL